MIWNNFWWSDDVIQAVLEEISEVVQFLMIAIFYRYIYTFVYMICYDLLVVITLLWCMNWRFVLSLTDYTIYISDAILYPDVSVR